ncbi:hypothetical protein Tco_0608173 [Tanacetum coccineum]
MLDNGGIKRVGKEISTRWEELVEKFFCKFYPESYDGEEEMLDEGDNWGIDPLEFISRVNSSFDKHMKSRWKSIIKGPRERNIDEYWWRIYKFGDLKVLES